MYYIHQPCCLYIGDILKDLKDGRANNRPKKEVKKNNKRNASFASNFSDGRHGITFENKLKISALGLELKRDDQHENESRMFALNLRVENAKSEIQRLERKAERRCPDYDSTNQY